jgi:predicted nucleotidyltransferase
VAVPADDVFNIDQVPERLRPAVLRIWDLCAVGRYQAAYLFGSVARHEASATSDLDVQVLTDRRNPCDTVNHPVISGVKLDVTFLSFEQLAARTQREIERGNRVPMVAESIVVFDKTGELTQLRASAQRAHPKPCTPSEHQAIQFGVFHANDKAERLLATDPLAASLVMHISVRDLLDTHYRIQGRWQISDKRLLADLRLWDPPMAALVERLVSTVEVRLKFAVWTEIVDYVMVPLGGRQAVADLNCGCVACRQDLAIFTTR